MGNECCLKPRVAIFDFASCEGCQLQIVNLEEKILDLAAAVDVVNFREAMKERSDQYDIAFVEGSIQRPLDEQRLKKIRANARVLVALGDCASTGCVNKLRNAQPIEAALKEVYANQFTRKNKLFDLRRAKALDEVVPVDFYIRGCPVRKEQVLYYIQRLGWMPLHALMDSRFGVSEKPIPVDDRSLVYYNPHKCILCRRCDAVCREALGIDALGLVGKGPEVVIGTPKNVGFDGNGCIRCGQCVASCSCGSLETESCVPQLIEDLQGKRGLKIAVDSVALSSYVEKNLFLDEVEPAVTEKHIIGALMETGFQDVLQYDRFLLDSIEKDLKVPVKRDGRRMLSWCKAAFNYVEGKIPESKLARSERNAPWTLLLKEAKSPVCLLTPCTALKGVRGFKHVLSVMELDELFKKLEIDPEFAAPADYKQRVEVGENHPGFSQIKSTEKANVTNLRISKQAPEQIDKSKGFVDLFPCLARCLAGGGNYPTTSSVVIENRCNWLEALWEANA